MYDISNANKITYKNVRSWRQAAKDCTKIFDGVPTSLKRGNKKKKSRRYIDAPCSFDIETTSFIDDENGKAACMYLWSMSLAGHVYIGRRWSEFVEVIHGIANALDLSPNRRLVIWVHNLNFEFQFFRNWFENEYEEFFALDERKPCIVALSCGIEFRCSFILSGMKLASLANNLHTYKINKLVGDLDYNKPRHSDTPLTANEINYSINDVQIVVLYIQEMIDSEGGIANIPLTKTGFVRRYVRDACYSDPGVKKQRSKKYQLYRQLMRKLTIEPEEYKLAKRAFAGGFTHGNPVYVNATIGGDYCPGDILSIDFASSYPAQMCAQCGYPMGKGEKVHIDSYDQFNDLINTHACIFTIEFVNIKSKIIQDHYISKSKCIICESAAVSNGRIISADRILLTITEVDYNIIKEVYDFDNIRVTDFYKYKRGYLPKPIIMAILKLFSDKTTLKGNVPGESEEYNKNRRVLYDYTKALLNATYGMMVTSPLRPNIAYDGDWISESPETTEAIDRYNTDQKRFLFFPWGIYVTAFARAALWGAGLPGLKPGTTGILEAGLDYVYSDTDSLKLRHPEKHKQAIHDYNAYITGKLLKMCDNFGIDYSMIAPKSLSGVTKHLGIWEPDGDYVANGKTGYIKRFKTLGAKRYMIEDDNGLHITVSGLNKHEVTPYMLKEYNGIDGAFEAFTNALFIPGEHSGKLTHTYIDRSRYGDLSGTLIDYLGNAGEYFEHDSIHLEPAEYSLTMASEFLNLLMKIKTDHTPIY